jgi:hypothetical protein
MKPKQEAEVARKDKYSDRAKTLAKEAAKGVVKEAGEISKGVFSELFKIVTLQKK